MSELEGRRAALDHQLVNFGRVRAFRVDRRQVERDLIDKLEDWRGLLRSEVQEARPILRLLIPDRITFEPAEVDGVRGCRYSGEFQLGALFDGVISGQERECPQRDAQIRTASPTNCRSSAKRGERRRVGGQTAHC